LRWRPSYSLALLLAATVALSLASTLPGLGRLPFNPDEAVYAAQARMWAGEWGLRVNFIPYSRSANSLQLHQLYASLFARLLGPSEWSLRLPSALMGAVAAASTAAIAWLLYGPLAGLVAGVGAALCPYLAHLSRQVHLDVTMVALGNLAVLSYLAWWRRGRGLYRDLAVLFYALSVMAKVSIAVPLAALFVAHLAYTRRLGEFIGGCLRSPRLYALLALPALWIAYFIGAVVGPGEYLRTVMLAVGRRSYWSAGLYYSTLSYFMGPPILLLGLAGALVAGWRRRWEDRFALTWALAVSLFFSYYPLVAYSYILPLIPPLLILSARPLVEARGGRAGLLVALATAACLAVMASNMWKVDLVCPCGPVRFNPVKYGALREVGLWASREPSVRGLLVYSFADHHVLAYYSMKPTYPYKLYPGMYVPVNGAARVVFNGTEWLLDEVVDRGLVTHVVYIRGSMPRRVLERLMHRYALTPVMSLERECPPWYLGGRLELTVYRLELRAGRGTRL